MEVIAGILIVIAFLGTIYPMRDIPKGALYLYNENTLGELKYDIKPMSEFKDENVVKQQYDYSCGSAALATLLKYYLGENLTEQQVLQGLFEYGDSKLIEQRRAFSLLDMKRFVEILGYKGTGYTAEIDDLKKLNSPAIIPIRFYGYTHFVVFKGIYQGHIFFADPFQGNVSFPLSVFMEMWDKNVVFVVSDGVVTTNALVLKEKDLKIITYDTDKEIPPFLQLPPSIITEERRFKESLIKRFITEKVP